MMDVNSLDLLMPDGDFQELLSGDTLFYDASPGPSTVTRDTESPASDAGVSLPDLERTYPITPFLKTEINYRIQKRRRDSGLEELKVDYHAQATELTPADVERRRRRRESNRRAAAKLRVKKKVEASALQQRVTVLESEKKNLQKQVSDLKDERSALAEQLTCHLAFCTFSNFTPGVAAAVTDQAQPGTIDTMLGLI